MATRLVPYGFLAEKPEYMPPLQSREDETPPDGFGADFLLHRMAGDYEDLCKLVGNDNARADVSKIIDERVR